MRKDVFGAARLLVLPTVALLAIALFAPGRLALGVRIYALILCGAVIVLLLLALRRSYPSEAVLRERPVRRARSMLPSSLARIENEVALGVASSFDLHYRLVPRLRTLTAGLLHARRKVSLSATPVKAHDLLGDQAWELVRPDRPVPDDRLAKGIGSHELGHVVDALETV